MNEVVVVMCGDECKCADMYVQYVEDGMGDENDYRMLPWQTVKCTETISNLPVSSLSCF